KPKSSGVLALILGMGGIAVLLGGQNLVLTPDKLLGIACAFAAAVLFAASTIAVRPPAGVAPISGTAWQLAIGSLPMLLVGIFIEQPESYALSTVALWSWLYM